MLRVDACACMYVHVCMCMQTHVLAQGIACQAAPSDTISRKKQQHACDAFSSLNLMIFRAAAESQVSCSATAASNSRRPAPQQVAILA